MIDSKHVSSINYEINARYFQNTAIYLHNKNGAVYVEGVEDVSFWSSIFEYYLPKNTAYKFYWHSNTIAASTKNENHTGSGECFKFCPFTNKYFLVCVDSDYHTILSTLPITKNDFIFETYTYSFENHLCFPENIAKLIHHITAENINSEIEDFINQLSPLCFELLAHSIVSEEILFDNKFFRHELNTVFRIADSSLSLNDIRIAIETNIDYKIAFLAYGFDEIEMAKNILYNADVNEQNAYLHIKGHAIYDVCIQQVIKNKLNEIHSIKITALPAHERFNFVKSIKKSSKINTTLKQYIFTGYLEIDKIAADVNRLIINHLT